MMTRAYEALVILKSGGTEQDLARHAAQLEEPIKKVGGNIESAQSMGRRKLAFRISKQAEGHYHLLRFQAPAGQVMELERIFRLNETIVRFMILTADEVAPSPSQAARSSASQRPSGPSQAGRSSGSAGSGA
jgi:small subunit ribosomal protein S6